jgi:hypothetical protein
MSKFNFCDFEVCPGSGTGFAWFGFGLATWIQIRIRNTACKWTTEQYIYSVILEGRKFAGKMIHHDSPSNNFFLYSNMQMLQKHQHEKSCMVLNRHKNQPMAYSVHFFA